MFKRKGGGVKGLLNNVKKNCTFLKGRLPLGDIKELLALGTKGAKVQQLGVWGDNRVNIYQQDKKFDYDFEQGVNLRYIWIYRVLSPHPLCGRI